MADPSGLLGKFGNAQPVQYGVALLVMGLPFPAKCALAWPGTGALRTNELTKQPTGVLSREFVAYQLVWPIGCYAGLS